MHICITKLQSLETLILILADWCVEQQRLELLPSSVEDILSGDPSRQLKGATEIRKVLGQGDSFPRFVQPCRSSLIYLAKLGIDWVDIKAFSYACRIRLDMHRGHQQGNCAVLPQVSGRWHPTRIAGFKGLWFSVSVVSPSKVCLCSGGSKTDVCFVSYAAFGWALITLWALWSQLQAVCALHHLAENSAERAKSLIDKLALPGLTRLLSAPRYAIKEQVCFQPLLKVALWSHKGTNIYELI